MKSIFFQPFALTFVVFLIISSSCQRPSPSKTGTPEPGTPEPEIKISVPPFNADSALAFVKAQCDFGPRVPGTPSHEACASYLTKKLQQYTPHVEVQQFKGRIYDASVLNGKNIIASFQPDKKARIMLCAHWDSRPYADHDPDPAKRNQPVMGANDGASGVGILLEVARLLGQSPSNVGVDIVFFDLEDHGPSEDKQNQATEHWGLGSQHWSKNPHVYNYTARFVILLDMVGARDARFLQEGFSMYYAPDKVKKVWDIARRIGYGEYFLQEKGGYINDDHYFINELRKIPAIDIIHLDPNSSNGSFFEYWHTTGDTFDKIDREMLGIVGRVVVEMIFSEK
jgi:hypothetical protein